MNRQNVLNLRSFWQIQIIGWCCFYLFDLLESIHDFLTKRVYIREETVPIVCMFFGSCALRPYCRRLRSLPHFAEFLSRALARLGCSHDVVYFYSLHVVQSVLQHQAMAAIGRG